ncbi:Cellulose synthase-like protein E6 [Camellia lanceoleosa]|uniref:Cellulose synthase-like protein E6 n=1 Tax=Camellia lanceoleosa TaxID=1840588 RepID=A0ACC0HWB7_9ERIC|nr:Cellulose synthase-like protein E6 [Camellia lanceoleosa]
MGFTRYKGFKEGHKRILVATDYECYFGNDEEKEFYRIQWHAVPCCLLSHLKVIEIDNFRGRENDLLLVEYFLKNAKILIDGRKLSAVDDDGHQLPTLVYLATEKRPQCPHNFKAGSMNALIRVSSEISNAPIILNLDCDMYSNDSDAIKRLYASSWMKNMATIPRELKNSVCDTKKDRTIHELEEGSKILANCSYEKGTQWGKECPHKEAPA